jgi:hypothetical protein
MSVIRYEELDQLAGELLPERTVLGVVSTPFNNWGGGGGMGYGYPPDHGAAALSACQSNQWQQTAGLLGDLSLNSQNPNATLSCIPAAAASSF